MMIRDDVVRQVGLDELTYQLFAGLRTWTSATRKRVFTTDASCRDSQIEIALEGVRRSLSTWMFVDPAAPAISVPVAEVASRLVPVIKSFPGAIPALWLSGQRDREREAQAAAAMILAAALSPFEILSTVPLDRHGARVVFFNCPQPPAYAFGAHWP